MVKIFKVMHISFRLKKLILILSLWGLNGFAGMKSTPDIPEIKMEFDSEHLEVYAHQPAIITLNLWTPEIDVASVRELEPLKINKRSDGFSSQHIDFNRRGKIVEKDGKRWYVYPVDSYLISVDNPGKIKLTGGKYKIGLNFPIIVDDPFWGKVQTIDTKMYDVAANSLDINVKKLPEVKNNSEFSGAVGDFNISVIIPPGDIFVKEEAIAVIKVRGVGWLPDGVLPEYRDAFNHNVKLKSFKESRTSFIENGQLVSELQMECWIIPESLNDSKIGEVRLEYFSPSSGKYQIGKSNPIEIKVVSITKKAPSMDI